MTDKEDNNNVKPIRKGLKIELDKVKQEEKLEPIKPIIEKLEDLIELAKSGDLRELCYVGIADDLTIYSGIVGICYDPHHMWSQLNHQATMYYDKVFYPRVEPDPYMFDDDDDE